jgi:hypothetical protein
MEFSAKHTKPPDNTVSQRSISFRDKLMGGQEPLPRLERMNLLEKNLFKIELEDGDRLKPKCFLDEGILEGLRKPLQEVVIIKLLGKSIGYFVMMDRLKAVWKPSGGMEIVDIGHGFFMVKFDVREDREKVIGERPWMIFDHYLAVSSWTPDFDPAQDNIDRTSVWIRIPGLGMEYYDESVLLALGAAVGKPVKVDIRTIDASRGKFARICIEIDLSLPVVGQIWFRDRWFHVEYEGLHLLCKNCGKYGHVAKNCSLAEEEKSKPTISVTGEKASPLEATVQSNMNSVQQKTNPGGDNQGNKSATSCYGDWLVVSKPKRNNFRKNNGKDIESNVGENQAVHNKIMEKNKYQILCFNEERDNGLTSQPIIMGESNVRPSQQGKRKSMDRKKRQKRRLMWERGF